MAKEKIVLPKLRFSSKRSISGQIYDFLRKQITETKLKPGTAFSENELSAHFNVSRQPVREALMRLNHEGLLIVMPQRGSIVSKISVSGLKQICFIRTSLECGSVLKAKDLDDKTFNKILSQFAKNLEKQRECLNEENTAIFLNLDDDFHELICSLSLCPMTWEVLRSVKGHMDRIRYLSMGNESPIAQLISEHEEIFEALKSKNFDHVVELLKYHLYEIMQTHISIRAKNSEWFEEEDE